MGIMDKPIKVSAELKFKRVVNEIIDMGIYPGPTVINKTLNHGQHNNHLNGRETRWRREVMNARGIKLKQPNAALPLTDYDCGW